MSRPVRQSRLKLALEEVLSTQSEPTQLSAHQQPSNQPPVQTSDAADRSLAAHVAQQVQLVAQQAASDTPLQAPTQTPGSPSRQSQSEIGSQGTGRQSDPMAGRLQPEQKELDPALSTQSMPSMKSSSPSAPQAEDDTWQHRRNSLQRAPKVSLHHSCTDSSVSSIAHARIAHGIKLAAL